MNPIEVANRSDEILYIRINEEVKKDYMIRRVKGEQYGNYQKKNMFRTI